MITVDEKYRIARDIVQICCAGLSMLMLSVVYLVGLPSSFQKALVLLTQASLLYMLVVASLNLGNTLRDIRYRSLRE